uniref:Cytochrome c oxidase subunit XI assembly protein n=1 Tax=Tetraselmis sp. GSL018 TaxID=582737 RepID=A0A061RKF6_9CHLO
MKPCLPLGFASETSRTFGNSSNHIPDYWKQACVATMPGRNPCLFSVSSTSQLVKASPVYCSSRNMGSSTGNRVRTAREFLQEGRGKSGEQAMYLAAIVISMVGITYLSVPLYRLFCQATGFGGTVQRVKTVEEKIRDRNPEQDRAAAERPITVEFNADVTDGMPWKFRPTQRAVQVKPGESALAFYTAENTSDKPVTGVSSYNVTPQAAGVYFNKIQCFCFEEQLLRPGEKVDMPVFFYIDPEMVSDPRLKGVVAEYPQLPQPGHPLSAHAARASG